MKTLLPLKKVIFGSVLLCFAAAMTAQNGLTNLSFETWTTGVAGPEPVGWAGTNVTQETIGPQHGSKYARLNYSNSFSGMLVLGDLDAMGAPIAANPASMSGFYKTGGMNPGDEMSIAALTQKGNSTKAVASFTTGNNMVSWTSFSVPFTVIGTGAPDTIIIIIMNNAGNTVGSEFDVDNLSLGSGTGTVTGLSEAWVGTSFMVYPNPANDKLNIISKNESAKTVVVSDILGKATYKYEIVEERTSIELSNYSTGLYFYTIVDSEGTVLFSDKFMVEK